MKPLICPICKKEIDVILPYPDLVRHLATHPITDIIISYAQYYCEQNDIPIEDYNYGDE